MIRKAKWRANSSCHNLFYSIRSNHSLQNSEQCKHIVLLIVIDRDEPIKTIEMKEDNKHSKKETDQSKEGHVDQNVYDFNPSQFTTEEEQEIIKKKKEEAKRKENKDKKKGKE